jgi:hypothetical protein
MRFQHHIADWDGQCNISISPSVILWQKRIEVFSAEAFHHDNEGEHVIDVNGQKISSLLKRRTKNAQRLTTSCHVVAAAS